MKSVIGKKLVKKKSNEFNNYFVSVGSTLASKINYNSVIHLTIFKVMFKTWPYLIIIKMMSHL